jgi:hypothetical protein
MGVGGQRHDQAAFTPRKDPVPIVQEAGWALGPVWIGAENLDPTGIRFPDLPARSESLYRLSYPDPFYISGIQGKTTVILEKLNAFTLNTTPLLHTSGLEMKYVIS